jgi:hypothetical protein
LLGRQALFCGFDLTPVDALFYPASMSNDTEHYHVAVDIKVSDGLSKMYWYGGGWTENAKHAAVYAADEANRIKRDQEEARGDNPLYTDFRLEPCS